MLGIFSSKDTIITPEKAAIVARLDGMKANNWEELQGMSDAELSALHDEVDAAHVILDIDSPEPHNRIRAKAYEAIKNERIRRRRIASEQWQAQQTRRDSIAQAANSIREASRLLDVAHGIPDLSPKPATPPTIDVATATDAELKAARAECQRIVDAAPCSAGEDARAIAAIKTDAAKAIYKELRAKARADADRRGVAYSIINDVDTERERRAAEREAQAEALKPEAMADRIAQLEAELANMRQEG